MYAWNRDLVSSWAPHTQYTELSLYIFTNTYYTYRLTNINFSVSTPGGDIRNSLLELNLHPAICKSMC